MSARIPRRGPYRRAAARQAGPRLCRLAAVRSSATGAPRFFTLALPVLFLVIITLAIISAAFGNLGPRPGPYFYTPEVM
jgi:hypothetical protein